VNSPMLACFSVQSQTAYISPSAVNQSKCLCSDVDDCFNTDGGEKPYRHSKTKKWNCIEPSLWQHQKPAAI